MDLEKIVMVGELFELYKELLTEKQQEIVSLYYEEDYSLGEISEFMGVSRQSIYDTVKRSEKLLKEYESKLNLLSKLHNQQKLQEEISASVDKIRNQLLDREDESLKKELDELKELVGRLIEE